MEDCGCSCEAPTTVAVQQVQSSGMEFGLCADCGYEYYGSVGLWVFLGILLLFPFTMTKIARALRNDIPLTENGHFLTFSAIANGRLIKGSKRHSLEGDFRMANNLIKGSHFLWQKTQSVYCAYCKDPPRVSGSLICPGCGGFHHVACYLKHGGCSVFGCPDNLSGRI